MKVLLTGGAGFIGSNLASVFLEDGHRVTIFDNLSRGGAKNNLEWLRRLKGDLRFEQGDIRDYEHLKRVCKEGRFDIVIHLAAQVAVTSSVEDPLMDLAVNTCGTVNLLEAVRASGTKPVTLFASTNKVYGGLEDIPVVLAGKRYRFAGSIVGISESRPVDFHSPYGCSKGAADQYVRDYARVYDIPTVVFRLSCVYGYRQFGIEDQGWVSWFVIRSLLDKEITVYGDGYQVRDILFIDDLVNVVRLAIAGIEQANGKIYNIGGGPANTVSLIELIELLQDILGKRIRYRFAPWRPGDQRIYVSDITKARQELGWEPLVEVKKGVGRLVDWVKENLREIERVIG